MVAARLTELGCTIAPRPAFLETLTQEDVHELQFDHIVGRGKATRCPSDHLCAAAELTGRTVEEITDGLNGLGLDVQPIPDDLAADIAMEKQLEAVLSSERPTPTAPTRRNRPIGQISLPALASVANDKVSSGELRFLANRLTEALRDALRVAESRGGRLLTPDEHGTDEPDDGH